MPITFTTDEVVKIAKGDISEELQDKINRAQKYEASAGLRNKVKSLANDNAAKFVTDNLSQIDIPDGISEITMIYDFSDETNNFIVRKSGISIKQGSDTLATPGAGLQSVVGKAFSKKDGDEKAIITDFLTKALGGQKIVDHVLTTIKFEKETKPALDALYTIGSANPLGAGIMEIPEGDKLRTTLQYKSVAADQPAIWHVLVNCSKTGGGSAGSGDGTRKKATSAPDGYKSWKSFIETDKTIATTEALAAVIKKHGNDWTKQVSPTQWLRRVKHPAILEADLANPARM